MEEKMKSTTMSTGSSTGNAMLDISMFPESIDLIMAVNLTARANFILKLMDDGLFEKLLAFLRMEDVDITAVSVPDEVFFKYRTVNGAPLKGLLRYGNDEVIVDFKTLPEDHMIPEVVEAQRNYFYYRMIKMCRRKMFMITNRELPKVKLGGLSPKELNRLLQLADALAEGMTEEERKENGWSELKERVEKAKKFQVL